MIKYIIPLLFVCGFVSAQSFAPPPGFPGSTAIHKDSSIIVNWAQNVVVTRGPINISDMSSALVSYGVDADGEGIADGSPVSLGDGGSALITFSMPIVNGPGPDFAVFENGFDNHYMEFAFVEVSSDGINFFRFESISEVQTTTQLGNFSFSDCSRIYNLAGKYKINYGVPFDLEELAGTPGLNVDQVTHIRLIDVVGSIDPQYGSYDSQGTIINDPFPTIFDSGGFDLDAVGVINQTLSLDESTMVVQVYPNPARDFVQISTNGPFNYSLLSHNGKVITSGNASNEILLDLSNYAPGIYFLKFEGQKAVRLIKF